MIQIVFDRWRRAVPSIDEEVDSNNYSDESAKESSADKWDMIAINVLEKIISFETSKW